MVNLQYFVVINYGIAAMHSPFEPGSYVEAGSDTCGLDVVAIKSYPS
jgi:hypothetical protein